MRVTFPHLGMVWVGVKHLLEGVGFEVVVPPPITKATIELGAKYSPEFICLPFKVMMGNYLQAIEAGAEAIFMLGGVGPCRLGYYAEVQREILADLGLPTRMIVLERNNFAREIFTALKANGSNVRWHKLLSLIRLSLAKVTYLDNLEALLLRERYREKQPGYCSKLLAQAVQAVDKAQSWSELGQVKTRVSAQLKAELLPPPAQPPLRVGIVGEIYMLIESSVNFFIGERLGELGVSVTRNLYGSNWVREHLLPDWRVKHQMRRIARYCRPYLPQRVGGHGYETVGYVVDYAKKGYDGLVQVLPLTCMPEIIAESILPTISKQYDIPVLALTFDEHAGETGLVTRLEAFVDMLRERRRHGVGRERVALSVGD